MLAGGWRSDGSDRVYEPLRPLYYRNDSYWLSSGMASSHGDAGVCLRVRCFSMAARTTRRRGSRTATLDDAGCRNGRCTDREPVAGDRRTVAYCDGGLEEWAIFAIAALAGRKDDCRGPVGRLDKRSGREKVQRNSATGGRPVCDAVVRGNRSGAGRMSVGRTCGRHLRKTDYATVGCEPGRWGWTPSGASV